MVPYVGVSTALQFMFSLYLVSGDEGSAAEEWADAARSAQQVSFNLGATGRTMANDTAPSRLSLRDRRRRRGASNEPSVSPVSPVPPRRSGGSRGAGTFSRNVLLLREEAQDEMARPPRSTVKQAIIDDGRACTITFNIDMMGPDIVRAVRNAMQSRQVVGPLTLHIASGSGWQFVQTHDLSTLNGQALRQLARGSQQVLYISHRASVATESADTSGRSSETVPETTYPEEPAASRVTTPRSRASVFDVEPGVEQAAGVTTPRSSSPIHIESDSENGMDESGDGDDVDSLDVEETMDVEEVDLPTPTSGNSVASTDDVVVTTTPHVDVNMEVGSILVNQNYSELLGGIYDPFDGHSYNTLSLVAVLGSNSLRSVYNVPLLTSDFRLAQAQAVADCRVLLVALTPPSAGSAIMRLMMDPEFQASTQLMAYWWVASPGSSQGDSARTELDLTAYEGNILAVCIPGQTSRLRRLGVLEERLLTTRGFIDMMDLAEEALVGVRHERERRRQITALREAQDLEFRQAQEDDTRKSVREDEKEQSGSTHPTLQEEQSVKSRDPPPPSLTPAEQTRASWERSALTQVVGRAYVGRK
uniref:Uncharacterized protein n=1 Tax=Branchiostoma floridae TaxID=7739 RepID=C3XVL6_BRAFL|eukprot:XP_002612133.1 hypothetical protein BRAFLDRAFT_96071 [Branchiostoma floridae]